MTAYDRNTGAQVADCFPMGPPMASCLTQRHSTRLQTLLHMFRPAQIVGRCQDVQRTVQSLPIVLPNVLSDQAAGFVQVGHRGDPHTLDLQSLAVVPCFRKGVETLYLTIAFWMARARSAVADVSLTQMTLELGRYVLR